MWLECETDASKYFIENTIWSYVNFLQTFVLSAKNDTNYV